MEARVGVPLQQRSRGPGWLLLSSVGLIMVVFATSRLLVSPPDPLAPAAIEEVMTRVADWQLAHPRHNLRDWTHDRHKTVDDRPFGGGPGMVLKPEPIFAASIVDSCEFFFDLKDEGGTEGQPDEGAGDEDAVDHVGRCEPKPSISQCPRRSGGDNARNRIHRHLPLRLWRRWSLRCRRLT